MRACVACCRSCQPRGARARGLRGGVQVWLKYRAEARVALDDSVKRMQARL